MEDANLPLESTPPSNTPFQQEILQRGSAFLQRFQQWAQGDEWPYHQQLIREAFLDGVDSDEHFESLEGYMTNGFLIKWHSERFGPESLQFLADMLKDRLLAAGYRMYMSDERQWLRENYVESIERHYLKPPMQFPTEEKADQLFGNATIEYRMIDRKAYSLRCTVHFYHDSKYADPAPYPALLEWLCAV